MANSDYRMVAIDLDDTLLDENLKISPRNKETLRQAAERGVVVTLATGRMFRSALPYALELGIEVPIITYHGAMVKNARSGEVLAERRVPPDLARAVLEEGYLAGVHMNIYLSDILYVDRVTPEGKGYARIAGVNMVPVGNLVDFLQSRPIHEAEPAKLVFVDEPGLLDQIQARLQKKFQDKLYITKSKPHFLEFMNPGASKGHALKNLAGRLGINRDQIIALGDSYNDLDMIEYAGLGIAVDNAPEAVKRKADYITSANIRDGVAEAVEKFVLARQQ